MRLIFALPLLTLAACSVDNDTANDQMTLEYNRQRVDDAADAAGRAADEAGAAVGNVAASTGRAIRNEIGDIDVNVDVDVTRNRSGDTKNETSSR